MKYFKSNLKTGEHEFRCAIQAQTSGALVAP